MKTKRLLIIVLLLTSLLLASCGSKETPAFTVPAGAQAGDLVDQQPCTYTASETAYSADCGTLVVPENRNDPNSRLIALPVIRVRALNPNPAEPIFFFIGGPGGSNQHFQHIEGLVDHHDFVQVGYRGIDGSVTLNCPEVADAIRIAPGDMLDDNALAIYTDASARCAARFLAEGVDLAGYTITETIADMEAARVALGYERINLLGESYGTRVEMVYEWMHPESLNRVAMVAVNPPGHFVWSAEVIDAQIADYARFCATDVNCSARTNDLTASMQRVSRNMPDHWLFFPIDEGNVKFLTFFMLFETIPLDGIPLPMSGPAAIDSWLAAEKGDPSGLALLSLSHQSLFMPNLAVFGDLLSKAISGGDYEVRADRPQVALDPPDAILSSPWSIFYAALVRGWPTHLIAEPYRQLQPTDVETLLVSGSLDFSTPPQFATNELLPYLHNGRQIILKDFGHSETFWSSQPEAWARLLNSYYDTGAADDSLYAYQPVNFEMRMGWPGAAKVALGSVVAVIALLVTLGWLAIRRIRSRRTIASLIHHANES
jgi:pimeloyl-ACP methyl ester carboxylesterase